MGKRVLIFENKFSDEEVFEEVLPEFYRFHAPAETRVSRDFPSKKRLPTRFQNVKPQSKNYSYKREKSEKTIDRATERNKHEFDLRNIKPPISLENLQKEIKQIFKLKNLPKRIEAFDVAHISGTNPVGANAVWENGKFIAAEYKFWLFDERSELETLQNSVAARFTNGEKVSPICF